MKSLQCLLTFLVIINSVNSQTGANLMIEYQVRFNDAYDRGRKDRLHKGYLFIQNNLSRFYMMAVEKSKASNENDQRFEPDTNLVIFTDQYGGSMVVIDYGFDGKPINIIDSLYPMEWQISNDTKTIDSLPCIKANCSFRGRNYEAWFSPDIPIPFGPWKMGGLPGLIVDLKDDRENMLIRITRITRSDTHIYIPANITYTMEEHIRKMKELMKKLRGNARTSGSGDCISCQSESKYEFFAWEKIPD